MAERKFDELIATGIFMLAAGILLLFFSDSASDLLMRINRTPGGILAGLGEYIFVWATGLLLTVGGFILTVTQAWWLNRNYPRN
jgi:hypothetical protein